MNSTFKRDFNLRTSDFDCNRHISPVAVLDLFQEVAGFHAEELGCGFEPLLNHGLLWVIVKAKYEVLCQPKMHSTVTVKTWPLPPTRLGFQREYLIEDANGNLLIRGTSDWVVMNSSERKLAAASDIYPSDLVHCTDKCFEERTARIRDFETDGDGISVAPSFCDLDMNGHVNNIRYAAYVLNAVELKADEVIRSFQTDYHREVKFGDRLLIETHREDNQILAKGTNQNGEKMFYCKIMLAD